ncbi:LamG domain-containing protein [Demequina sediminis]|uniref:LamG domain-containing protein n=1 Tax=Demequina sediminis TaxID=1930058 RepID=UPI0025727DEA|nr:LamG domain-containing protein [Demequina sediminis]
MTLTATAVNGEATGSKDFEVTVLATTEAAGEAAWSFDGDLTESTGTYAPATTTGNRLTTTGGTASYVDDGVVGSALRLDGESGVRLPDGLIRTHQYSVSLWLRPAALTQFTTAFFGGPTTTSWISLNPRGWSDTTMLWSGEAWYDAVSPTLIPTGEWTHVAFTVDEGAVTLYLDGEPAFAGTGFPDVFTTDDAVFGLGVNHWDVPYEGDIDELGVWSRSLTPTEIADLANPVDPEPSFIDVEGSEHAVAIGWLAAEGISTGWSTPSGQEFRPLAQIKRDAMAAFLYRYSGSPEVTLPAESPFVDVTPTSTEFYEEIMWMFQEGISTGWETSAGREFRPLAPVKRDAMAAFLYRYAGQPAWTDPGESPFVDVTASSTEFFTEITWLESTGITTGWSTPAGQEYRPLAYTKRDAMATFLYRFDQLD